MKHIKLSLLFIVSTVIAGCHVGQLADASATPMPEEAYWAKLGYSLEKTREYMRDTCRFGAQFPDDYIERRRNFEQCMLNGGFVYMRDQHGLINQGFAQMEKSRCTKGHPFAELPGCRSTRF